MAYNFDEIMRFNHPHNREVYDEIVAIIKANRGSVVPFVGAGLTAFAYGSWSGALKALAGNIHSKQKVEEINKMIEDGKYPETIQMLEDIRKPINLSRDIVNYFSSKKLNTGSLHKQAISVLPYLFPGLVITTNFDQGLETVYSKYGQSFTDDKHDNVFYPGSKGLLGQAIRQNRVHCLYKLHGTVIGDYIEYDQLVFGEEQYNKHYGPDSPLVNELKMCFDQKVMLFLGCSLNQDRTMDVLQKVVDQSEGVFHYTIINCKESEIDDKIGELGDKHIRAIVYEGNRHEAVRVILEKLLEDINPVEFQKLTHHESALKPAAPINPFLYNAEIIPFIGRTTEIAQLNDFLGDPEIAFRWWAVTGPGGSGKSRLAYEFAKSASREGWDTRLLKREDYEDLNELAKQCTHKTLLIADYVQEHAVILGKWLGKQSTVERSTPLRVLLVEREADENLANISWVKQLYEKAKKRILDGSCYSKSFMELPTLDDTYLLEIMDEYVDKRNEKGMPWDNDKKALLLEKLKEIDPELHRPLYALFLADAYLEGNEPEKWNTEKVLDYVLEREKDRLKGNIVQEFGDGKHTKLINACEYLWCMATVLQDAPIEILKQLCPNEWAVIENKAEDHESPEEMLSLIGLASGNSMSALRPDLVGEYLVYDWLTKHQNKVKYFLNSVWTISPLAAIFFNRLFKDYNHLLNESPEHWSLLMPGDLDLAEINTTIYAGLFVNAAYYCNSVEYRSKLVDSLASIASSEKHKDNINISISLAKALTNLSAKQDAKDCADTVNRLDELAKNHNDNNDNINIVIILAQALTNLSAKQDIKDCADTVNRLDELAKNHNDNIDIVIQLAYALFNLSCEQDVNERTKTIDRLEKLASKHNDNINIVIILAQALTNLSAKQDAKDCADTINRLDELANNHNDNIDIVIILANALFNLSCEQDVNERTKTIDRLEKLAKNHNDNINIVIILANALFNLGVKQSPDGCDDAISRLQKLNTSHPNTPEIMIHLIILRYIAKKQGPVDTVIQLIELAKKYPQIKDDADRYITYIIALNQELFQELLDLMKNE